MSERFKPENESGKEFDFAEEFSIGNIQHKLIPESPKVELKGVKNYNLGEGISLAVFADVSNEKLYARAYHAPMGKTAWYESILPDNKN